MFGCRIATELFILSVSANTIHFGLVPIAFGIGGATEKPDYQVHNMPDTICSDNQVHLRDWKFSAVAAVCRSLDGVM